MAKLFGGVYSFDSVRRWVIGSKLGSPVLASECVLVPVNVTDEHWFLVAIYPGRRRMDCYDAFYGDQTAKVGENQAYLEALSRFMDEPALALSPLAGPPSPVPWTFEHLMPGVDIPRQVCFKGR